MGEILITKKIGMNKVEFRVGSRGRTGKYDETYKNVINIKDYKQLASMLQDIYILFDAPIDKAYRYIKEGEDIFL